MYDWSKARWGDSDWRFNHLWKGFYYGDDAPDLDWDSYDSLIKYENDPVFGSSIRARRDELYNEENDRYWSDLERNYGFSRDDLNYPIRSGIYGRGGNGYNQGISLSDEFVNSYAFLGRLMKW